MSSPEALHLVAHALGVPDGSPSLCAICGPSPFPSDRPLPDSFADHEMLAGPVTTPMCTGCARVLGGRPGDDPPPLRTITFRATCGGVEMLRLDVVWAALKGPPDEPHVLSWAVARKRHHVLHAGLSRPGRLLVGSDTATIGITAVHRPVMDAVAALIGGGLTRTAVATGDYSAPAVCRFGVARWREHERVVAEHRPSPLLDLLATFAPGPTDRAVPAPPTEDTMIDPHDDRAANLLAAIARASSYRKEHGTDFWRAFFRHRVERFRHHPLPDLVSRLLDACQVSASDAGAIAAGVAQLATDEARGIEAALRERATFLVALAYDRSRREQRSNQ